MKLFMVIFAVSLGFGASYAHAEVASLEEHRPSLTIQGDAPHAESEDLLDRLPPIRLEIALGPALTHGLGGKTDLLFAYTMGVHFDFGRFSPRVYFNSAHSYGQTGMSEFHGGIGMDYYFSDANSAPLAGADLAYGWVNTGWRDNGGNQIKYTGASAGLRGGYAFFRNTPMCLTVMGTWRSVLGNTQGSLAGMYGLEFGLQF